MDRLVLLALLLISAGAHADDDIQRCKHIGDFARAVAESRDAGVPKEKVLQKLPRQDSPARRVVEAVYREPNRSANDWGLLELTCLLDSARSSSSPSR